MVRPPLSTESVCKYSIYQAWTKAIESKFPFLATKAHPDEAHGQHYDHSP